MQKTLRARLLAGDDVVMPGVGDALTARMVERAGFDSVYMSGYQVSACLGYPDVGLVTLSEMVDQARRICATVSVPVLVDGDNGHGNAVQVRRTVRDFEQVGVQGLHLEDQALPKKCGAMSGHTLISTAEMCGKVEAAMAARRSEDFLIIARSDAIASTGIDEAIARGKAYRAAGAEALMVMAARSPDDLKAYRDAVDGPLVTTVGSWSFEISASELSAMGYQVALFPLTTLRRTLLSAEKMLADLKAHGTVDHNAADMMSVHDLHDVLGLDDVAQWEERYLNS